MTERDRRVELLAQFPYREINELLQQNCVAGELEDTWIKAHLSRCPEERDESLKNPPRFRFVSEFHSLIYDKSQKRMVEGPWSDLHKDLVRKNDFAMRFDLDPIQAIKNGPLFISGYSFVLRGLPQTKVIIIDSLYSLTMEVLGGLQKRKNTVMNQSFKWIMQDPANPEKYLEIPSPMVKKS